MRTGFQSTASAAALVLAAMALVLPVRAGESSPVNGMLSGVTLSGYVDTSAIWNFGSGIGQSGRFDAGPFGAGPFGLGPTTTLAPIAAVPEPGTWALLGAGATLLLCAGRRGRRRK